MNKYFLLLLVSVFLAECKDNDHSCANDRALFGTQIFDGMIYLCNAQPPDQLDLKGKAYIDLINDKDISIRVVSDTVLIDTILFFGTRCGLVEDSPVTFMLDSMGKDVGQYHSQYNLAFAFGYPNCLENSFFEGLAEK